MEWDIVYYNENRDLVNNLLDLLKSNQTITSLTLNTNPHVSASYFFRMIFDEIFINNKTITKLNLGYLEASSLQLTDKFYQSLYDSSVTKLSITIRSGMNQFYEMIKNPHCNIQSLKVHCFYILPIELLESMKYNLSIKYLTIFTPSKEPIRLTYNHSLQRLIYDTHHFRYSYDSSCLVEFYQNFEKKIN
ncbi:hypothetical protein DLAC_08520 [Tieghemostelium lacteum]|uniref:Uncharacterized protein n=1 Tax=Tieghemostelium lacteum TaxID=361077 RepID=A0A151Z7K8_TIELA|nr:hypothetical protein DLAC_08520 [Tieghemostelium lacteum]|eukprot:KYQ89949.1 hypothetical protein DLAC_08520 [Tieghemostelium lacteum]